MQIPNSGGIPIELNINDNAKSSVIIISATIIFVSLVALIINLKKAP